MHEEIFTQIQKTDIFQSESKHCDLGMQRYHFRITVQAFSGPSSAKTLFVVQYCDEVCMRKQCNSAAELKAKSRSSTEKAALLINLRMSIAFLNIFHLTLGSLFAGFIL